MRAALLLVLEAAYELEARANVTPLVAAANLQPAAVLRVQVIEVVRLEDLVREFQKSTRSQRIGCPLMPNHGSKDLHSVSDYLE
jgi:hypothetical protein